MEYWPTAPFPARRAYRPAIGSEIVMGELVLNKVKERKKWARQKVIIAKKSCYFNMWKKFRDTYLMYP